MLVRAVAEDLPHTRREVDGIPLALEAEQIRAEQTPQNRVSLWQLREKLERGEGNVVEPADRHVRAEAADHLGNQL